MKKLIFTAAALSLVLAACGDKKDGDGEESSSGPDVCDCVNMGKEMAEKMQEAGGDEDAMKALEEEYKDDIEACEELGRDLSDEEREELMKQVEEC